MAEAFFEREFRTRLDTGDEQSECDRAEDLSLDFRPTVLPLIYPPFAAHAGQNFGLAGRRADSPLQAGYPAPPRLRGWGRFGGSVLQGR